MVRQGNAEWLWTGFSDHLKTVHLIKIILLIKVKYFFTIVLNFVFHSEIFRERLKTLQITFVFLFFSLRKRYSRKSKVMPCWCTLFTINAFPDVFALWAAQSFVR